jgi:hypothetical protein
MEPVTFVMERKMLQTIKHLAEGPLERPDEGAAAWGPAGE